MLIVHVLAQAAVAAAPPPADQGVISYPASFFADQQPANAAEMVERTPGFLLDTGDSVRGYEGAAGNVLIDGKRPATKTDDLESILRRLPASRVERIDIIRGGAPGIDMQGKSVIANVVRKPGGMTGLVAVAQNHTWDGRTAPAMRIEGQGDLGPRKWELGVFWGKAIDDGYGSGPAVRLHPDARPDVAAFADTEGDLMDAQATGAFETPLLGGQARFNGRAYTQKFKFEEDFRLLSPAPGLETTDEVTWTDETELGVNYTRSLGARTSLELVGLRQDRERSIVSTQSAAPDTVTFALDRDTSETIGRAVLKHRFGDRLSVEGGGELAVNELDSRTSLHLNGAPGDLPAANVAVKEERGELFVKSAWRPASGWTVDSSLRYESSTISSEGDVVLEKTLRFWKPRVTASWDALPSTQLRVRVERQVGQLNFDDFVATSRFSSGGGVTAGNPDLDPEQAWVAEAAVEHRFWRSGSVVVAFRHFELKDVVDRGPVTAPTGEIFDRPENIGDGTKDELALEWNIPFERVGLRGVQLRGDLTKRWSEVVDPTTGETREISGLHPLDWNAYLTHDIPRWRLTWGVSAYGGWRETYYRYNLVETTKLKTFVHPFLEWKPQPDIHIRVELPNVTERGLRRTVAIYPGPRGGGGQPVIEDRDLQPGRMWYVRVRKTFGG